MIWRILIGGFVTFLAVRDWPLTAYSVEKLLFQAAWKNLSFLDRLSLEGCTWDYAASDRSLQGTRFAYNRGS